jgi:ureidoglycolate hydrolase
MDVRRIAVQDLDDVEFSRFGSIIGAGEVDDPSLNRAPGQMAFLWIHQSLAYPSAPYIATGRYYFRGNRCEYMQRHPGSTVVLVPIGGHPSVIFVAPPGNEPSLEDVVAVRLDGDRGVVINQGVWMRYAYPLVGHADFAYVSARVDPEDDIERFNLEEKLDAVLEWVYAAPTGQDVRLSPGGAVVGLPHKLPAGTVLGPGGLIQRS